MMFCAYSEEDGDDAGSMYTVFEELQSTLRKVRGLWDEVGLSTADREQKIASLKEAMRHFYSKEETNKNALLKKVNDQGQEVFHLAKSLDIYSKELFDDEGLTLMQLEQQLTVNLKALHVKARERRAEFEELQLHEQELCEQLIEEPSPICKRDVPSTDELADIKRRINTLKQEKKYRSATFRKLKDQIINLLKDLDRTANSSFENTIVNCDERLFTLSLVNIEDTKKIKQKLTRKVASNAAELKEVQAKVQTLWERLEVPQCDRQLLVVSLTEKVPGNIQLYRGELTRLEELRKASLVRLISSVRQELDGWWAKCYVAAVDRITAYSSADCSEAVLSALEAEVGRLASLHQSAQHIYAKLDQRRQLWDTLIGIEQRCNDPARLFKNRGCALLREERERNRVKGELPRVEAMLQESVTAWEQQEGAVFTVMGVAVHDYIHQQWEEYTSNKLSKTKQRHDQRAAQVAREARMGTLPPVARRLRAANSTLSRKNSSAASSSTASSHRSAMLSRTKQGVKRCVLSERNPNTTRTTGNTSTLSTYSQFVDNIAMRCEKDQIRSSAMRSPCTPRHPRTPLLVCRSPRTPSGGAVRPSVAATMPRFFRPLPRVAMLPSKPSPSTITTPRDRTAVNTTRNVSSTVRHTSSVVRHATLYKRSPVSSRGGSSPPCTLPRRRSARLKVPLLSRSKGTGAVSSPRLTTPARNKLQFLI